MDVFVSKNRKGIMSFNFLVMIPRIMFLVIMMIVCVILLRMFLNNKFNVTDTQSEVLIDGLLYGAGGIGYFDPVTGRNYPEIIDVQNLDSFELDNSLFYPANNLISARISVGKGMFLMGDASLFRAVYYNKQWYDNWEPLLNWNIAGIGGVAEYNRKFPVILRRPDGSLTSGEVHFQVVQPRSARARR
ncbi:hypothetical protein JW898_01230 [Candidatus Woesearchaeota archaeon]|nr:hypothetical protein [Candidatus Woesearchaeota archaeon]